MKRFYILSLLIVAILTASPFVLLEQSPRERFAAKVVAYNLYRSKVKSIDPATSHDTTSHSIQAYIYEACFDYHYLKRPVELIPKLAKAMPEVSPDGLTYTIHLKRGVKFSRNPCFGVDSDGRPKTRTLKAEDFVTGFKRIADYHITSPAFGEVEDSIEGLSEYHQKTRGYQQGDFSRYTIERISGVVALDDYTLQIKLKKTLPQLTYILAKINYAPTPLEVIEYHLGTRPDGRGGREPIPMAERSPEIHDAQAVVGTGPYVLAEWIRGGEIVLTRNPDFRDDFYPTEGEAGDMEAGLLDDAGKKLPFVDVRYFRFVGEDNPAWMLFLTRQCDVAAIPRDVFASVISPSRELAERWRQKGIRLFKYTYPAIYYIGFNMDDPVVGKSKSLRQAMCLAYDVDKYIEVIYNGRGRRAIAPVPSELKGVDKAGPSPYARLDVEAAKEKIILAKKELIAAGVIRPGENIPELTLDLPGTGELLRRIGEFSQGEFKKIGLNIKIEMSDWPTFQKKVVNGQFQLYSMGGVASIPDADDFLQGFYSRNIARGINDLHYRNDEFDRLYEQAARTVDEEARTDLYARLIRIVNEDCPMLLLSEPLIYRLAYNWVHNFKPHPLAYGMGKHTRIDAEARQKAGGL